MRKIKQPLKRKTYNPTDSNKVLVDNVDVPRETETFFESHPHTDNTLVPVNELDLINLNDALESMIERVNGNWSCKICGKNDLRNHRTDYKRHAEKHLEGVSHSCNICDKVFRNSNTMRVHKKLKHCQN